MQSIAQFFSKINFLMFSGRHGNKFNLLKGFIQNKIFAENEDGKYELT